ncbi:hypothetical protein H5410_006372 [Solanum commersonii]|uniref:Uncharacterized protein n=1 Tax=Solanum commersonii TaxID=4109 RepID=A0A9J6AA90_SOLCO|nr:hypothetical protein H5410_006372 [Solanum commersonii]
MGFLDFITDITLVTILKKVPLNRDLQERILWRIIDGMMIKTKCYVCTLNPPWVTKTRGRGSYTRGRGRSSSSKTSGSLYGSSSSSPIIQRGGMSLVKLTSSSKEATSSIHLYDILENNPLYAQLRTYLSQKQSDNFASVAKKEVDDIRSYERHFSDYNTSENVYNFSKMIIKQIISIEDWVLYYNNERHKHTWFIKVCAKIFVDQIPNWFFNWWLYHGPTKDLMTKSLYGQELLDSISQRIQDYGTISHKGIIADNSVKHIARRISIQDGNKEEMIKEYLDEIRRNLLLNITHYEKSDTSMRSETSDDLADDTQEAQPCESAKPVT